MRRILFTITLIAAGASAALSAGSAWASTTVYRWVDAQGIVHYSDQPHPGAQKMHVEDAPTFSAPPVPQIPGAALSEPPAAAPPQSCSIESPGDQQTLMNVWSVSGHIRMPPHLGPDARVVLMYDGKVLPGAADPSGSFHISQADRGAHTLAAQVQGPDGQVICQTPQITFYVHQPSRLAPNPVNRPRF